MTVSGVYSGRVNHTRFKPRRHRLSYGIFQLFLDLEEIPDLGARLRWFSADRFNLVSFHASDHLDGSGSSLRAQIRAHLVQAGLDAAEGPIRVLCMPRVLGQVFNPLTLWFCHRPDGGLAAILYEVNNTFGERHSYLIPVAADESDAAEVRQACGKTFFVSPLMPMDLTYRFRIRLPTAQVRVEVRADDASGPMLSASFTAARAEITDRALLSAVARAPLLMLKVLAGIHWEALRTWLKGVRLRPRPTPPDHPVTLADGQDKRLAA